MRFYAELKRRNVIRVGAAYAVFSWLLIQIAATTLPLFGFDEAPSRFVVIILAIGFVPALVFAWAFELTPSGIKKDEDVDRSGAEATGAAKRLDRTIMVVLAVGLLYFAIDKFILSQSREAAVIAQVREEAFAEARRILDENPSVAVLPFQDLSPGQDQRFFADGVAVEILNILDGLENLNVIARSSSFQFRGPGQDLKAVGERLGVTYVLEGSVSRSGETIRVMAELADARTGMRVWSGPFEARLEDIFAIQKKISREVAGALSIALDIDGRNSLTGASTDNVEAYLAFLAGMELVNTSVEWDRATAYFDRALVLDPDYLDAIVQRGVMYGLMSFDLPPEEARQSQERGLQKVSEAIAIDPTFARAYDVLARFIWTRGDWIGATRTYEKYAALAPADIPAQLGFANVMARTGRVLDAMRITELKHRMDPVSFLGAQVRAERLIQAGRFEEASQALAEADRIRPPPSQGTDIRRLFLAFSAGEREGIRTALANYTLADARASATVEMILRIYDDEAATILQALRGLFASDESLTGEGRVIIASMAAHLGDPQLALEVFDREFEVNLVRTNRLWYRHFSDMRKLPGFKILATRLGFVDYWRTYGWADSCRAIGDNDFECA